MKISLTLTLTNGAPVNLYSGLSAAAMATAGWTSTLAPTGSTFFVPFFRVKRLFIQMLPNAGGGTGYVLQAGQGRAPAIGTAGQLIAELVKAADVNTPGGSYSDTDPDAAINISEMWIDGTTGNTVLVTYDPA